MLRHQSGANGSAPVQRGPRRRENPKPSNESEAPVAPARAAPKRKAETKAGKTRSPSLLESIRTEPSAAPAKPQPKRPMGYDAGTRAYYQRRLGALETERASWVAHWRELAEYFLPRTQRFWWTDRNRGIKRNEKIINNTGPIALRTMSSGMHSGLTSPARPWFRFTTPDPRLMEEPGVEQYLHDWEELARLVIQRSNLYSLFPQSYSMMGGFGTNVLWLDDDPHTVVRGKVFPIGSYSLGMGPTDRVDTVYRNVSMSVGAVVEEFGYEACSTRVRDLYDHGALDQWVLITHACEPNRYHNPSDFMSKPWVSVWFEREAPEEERFLRRRGYSMFPAAVSRWDVCGEDIYGYCPAMDALGDQRALQQLERRKLATADKIVNPPMMAPSALKNQRISLLAGDQSYYDMATPAGAKFEPVITVPYQAMTVEEGSIREHERRINASFLADLWLMIAQDNRASPATAEEIRAKMDEKMLQLGPVVERIEGEFLDHVIDRVCSIMEDRGISPGPPPPALVRAAERGETQIRIEYISILAQAVKMVGTAAIDRQVAFTANLAKAGKPEALDLLNTDVLVREYARMLGTNPETLNSPEEVDAIRQARAQAEQQEVASQQALTQAQAAAHAGRAAQSLAAAPLNDPNGPSALTGLLGTLGPAAVEGAGPPNGGIGP